MLPAHACSCASSAAHPLVCIWLLLNHAPHISHGCLDHHLQTAQQLAALQLSQQTVRLQHSTYKQGGGKATVFCQQDGC
jgi:hypothetical protein